MIKRKYGWRPSLPNANRPKYCAPRLESLPASVDMQGNCPPVYDQGELGSCTANAISGDAEFLMMKLGLPAFTPSRLFIYYNERVLEGTVSSDSGASISDSMKVVSTNGCPPESMWWYNTAKFTVKPSKKVYTAGLKHLVSDYQSLDNTNLSDLQTCLSEGYPFVLGFTVYESFESQAVASTGVVPMPAPGEQILGGHAVCCVGYDNASQRFLIRNSWGTGWGINGSGYCTMPYAYLTNSDYASDFWMATTIAA